AAVECRDRSGAVHPGVGRQQALCSRSQATQGHSDQQAGRPGGDLKMTTQTSGRDPVEKLAEEFAERFRRGERPALTEYTQKYPELAEQIRELFPAMVVIEQFGSVAESPTGPFGQRTMRGGYQPQQLGEYRIMREVGRGGRSAAD